MKNIDDLLLKLKKHFSFLCLTDKEFLSDINKKICLVDKKSPKFYDDVYEVMVSYYINRVSKYMDLGDVSYLYGFINHNIKYSKILDKNIDSVTFFIEFLNSLGDFDKRIDIYVDVVGKSQIMSKIFKNILFSFGVAYADFIDDNNLINLIDKYCLANKFKLSNEVKIEYSSFNDDVSSQIFEENYSYNIDDVRIYLNQIGKIPLLSIDEERKYAFRYYDSHDMEARNKLIEHNLRLCLKPASKFCNRGVPFMDLIEDANMGLIKAVDRFNPHKGYKLSTYALYWIYQTLGLNFNATSRLVAIPLGVQENVNHYVKIKNELAFKLGREATYKEIEEYSNLDIKMIYLYEDILKPITSVNILVGEDDTTEFIDMIPDSNEVDFENNIYSSQLREKILCMLDSFTLKQRTVILVRYGFYDGKTHTLQETAKILQSLGITDNIVSYENIRQIENRALKNFRDPKNIKRLTKFIG